jgi:hypothetical protein
VVAVDLEDDIVQERAKQLLSVLIGRGVGFQIEPRLPASRRSERLSASESGAGR